MQRAWPYLEPQHAAFLIMKDELLEHEGRPRGWYESSIGPNEDTVETRAPGSFM